MNVTLIDFIVSGPMKRITCIACDRTDLLHNVIASIVSGMNAIRGRIMASNKGSIGKR